MDGQGTWFWWKGKLEFGLKLLPESMSSVIRKQIFFMLGLACDNGLLYSNAIENHSLSFYAPTFLYKNPKEIGYFALK